LNGRRFAQISAVTFALATVIVSSFFASYASRWKGNSFGKFTTEDWEGGRFETPPDNTKSFATYRREKPGWREGDYFEMEWKVQACELDEILDGPEYLRIDHRLQTATYNGSIAVIVELTGYWQPDTGYFWTFAVTYEAWEYSGTAQSGGSSPQTKERIFYEEGGDWPTLPIFILRVLITRISSNTVQTIVYWKFAEEGEYEHVEVRYYGVDWSEVIWEWWYIEEIYGGAKGFSSANRTCYSDSIGGLRP